MAKITCYTNEEGETFFIGDSVRIFSSAGPCLAGTTADPTAIIRFNPKSMTINWFGWHRTWPKYRIHKAPCSSCTDHQRTQYPNGYMD